MSQDCRTCRNCRDQKRYGGLGRLKKACMQKQCVVMTQMTPADPAPVSAAQTEPLVFSIKSEAAPAQTVQLQMPEQYQLAFQPLSYNEGARSSCQALQTLQYTTSLPGHTLQYTSALPGQALQAASPPPS